MKRTQLNFLIDSLSFAAFVFLVTTGVLMRYILPPGSGRDLTIWGLDRHEWGGIHFWISVVFFALMALHLFLHWNWIVNMVKGKPGREGSGKRAAIGVFGLVALLAIALAPLFSPVETDDAREGTTAVSSHVYDEVIIRGSMTLGELEERSGVPSAFILEALDLRPNIPDHQRLGNLVRQYDLEMDDIRRVVQEYREEQ